MFGSNIKKLREERGLTQREMAEKTKININTLASYEKGTREPSFQTLINLSNFFGRSTDFLLGLSNVKNVEHLEQVLSNNNELSEVLKKYETYEIRGRYPISKFLADVIGVNRFSFALSSMCDYVMFDEENSGDFRTMAGTVRGGVQEIPTEDMLDYFLISSQTQIIAVCRELRKKRLQQQGGLENGKK